MTATLPRLFSRQQVSAICRPSNIARMHDALVNKPDATVGELVALGDALRFSLAWHGGDETVFFTIEEIAKHCEAVLAIDAKHFVTTSKDPR